MMALDTEIIILNIFNLRHMFSFYSYICKLGKHAGSADALIYYIVQWNICMVTQSFEIKVRMSGFCVNRLSADNRPTP